MASVNDIFGRIGAAKAFSSGVSNVVGANTETAIRSNESEISRLTRQLRTSTDARERADLERRINRLQRRNKALASAQKVTKSSTDFLAKIAEYCDIGKEELVKWIATVITQILPGLEVSVKAILLSDFKRMLSCGIDPRIPDHWRQDGEIFSEQEIDPRMTLLYSPFSKYGKYYYFGVGYNDDGNGSIEWPPVSTLARAEDMNAFLWYVKNTIKTLGVVVVENVSDVFNEPAGTTLYSKTTFLEKEGRRFLPGTVFKQGSEDAITYFICTDRLEYGDNTYIYHIVPLSESWNETNWYGFKQSGIAQSFFTPKPIVSVSYTTDYIGGRRPQTGNFRLKIKPKPFSMVGGFMSQKGVSGTTEMIGEEVTSQDNIDAQLPHIQTFTNTARFNGDGNFDRSGKFSVDTTRFDFDSYLVDINNKRTIYYAIRPKGSLNIVAYLIFNKTDKSFHLSTVAPTDVSPTGIKPDTTTIARLLTECYFGKTVYEFNYDYINSFKLFDEKVIAAAIVNGLLGIDIPKRTEDNSVSSAPNSNQIYIDSYIDRIVERLVDETDEEEYSDCFYTFSNEEYRRLEAEVFRKVENGELTSMGDGDGLFNEAYDILEAYRADATLHDRTGIITRSIWKAAENADTVYTQTDGDSSDTMGVTVSDTDGESFILKACKILISQVVNALLTPKVMLLMQMNARLTGSDPMTIYERRKDAYDYRGAQGVETVLMGVSSALNAVIKEVIDKIQEELLRMILARLAEIMNNYLLSMGVEYAQKWYKVWKSIIECFKFNRDTIRGSADRYMGEQYNDAVSNAIKQVDYADIDDLVDKIVPDTRDCRI